MPSIKKQSAVNVLDEALRLHEAGWWVVPQQGKRALVLGWDKARLGEDDLRSYLGAGNLNIAVVLSRSSLIDVECDGPEAERKVRELCAAGELLTPTWRSARGLHRLFKRPPGLPDRAAVEAGGIEFRIGNKPALSTVPPSRGDDGRPRAWLPELSVWEITPSPLPAGLARLLAEEKRPVEVKTAGSETITEGARNDELFRYGCRLLGQGLAKKDIDNALAGANKRQCRPPLADAEVAAICASVEKYRAKQAAAEPRAGALALARCGSWPELLGCWRRAVKVTDGFAYGLAVSLACAASVRIVGDQIWIKLMPPPSTGKSMIAEALAVCRAHVKCIDVFKGFYSGYQNDAEGVQNVSLLEELNDKAFVVKDGDSVMNMPNWKEIMGAARAIYDTSGRVSFRNLMSRDWEGVRFPWLLCGTKTLRLLDHSELGQRFLDCRIMDRIDDDLEDEIGWRKINLVRDARFEVDGRPESLDTPEMIAAKAATAGYLSFLRANVGRFYAAVTMGDAAARRVMAWAKLIALFRARPSKVQEEEEAGREMSARLVSQLGKLAGLLAVVLGKSACEGEPLAMVRRVAVDTAQGQTLTVAQRLRNLSVDGADAAAVGRWLAKDETKARTLLLFLRQLGVVEDFTPTKGSVKMKSRWRLIGRARELLEAADA